MNIRTLDIRLIRFFKSISDPLFRIGLFIVYFWFGFLKVINVSPATELVQRLFEQTIPFISFSSFLILFGIFECLIGVLFLTRGAERIVIPLLFLHMIATFLPLILLPQETWTRFLVPTLEGQYIIKNVVLIAAATGIAAHLHPLKNQRKRLKEK